MVFPCKPSILGYPHLIYGNSHLWENDPLICHSPRLYQRDLHVATADHCQDGVCYQRWCCLVVNETNWIQLLQMAFCANYSQCKSLRVWLLTLLIIGILVQIILCQLFLANSTHLQWYWNNKHGPNNLKLVRHLRNANRTPSRPKIRWRIPRRRWQKPSVGKVN